MSFPIFEAAMLLCFGAAWPFSIIKSIRSKSTKGKSLFFLLIVDSGYVFGTIHKVFWSMDAVIILYALNFVMVTTDIFLFFKNRRIEESGLGLNS